MMGESRRSVDKTRRSAAGEVHPPGATQVPKRRGWSPTVSVLSLVATQLLAVAVSFLLAFTVRDALGERGIIFVPLAPELGFFLRRWPILAIWPVVLWREGLYPGLWLTPDEELRRLIEGTTLASLLVITLTFVTQTGAEFSRPILIGWWLFTLLLLPLNHIGTKLLLGAVGARGARAVLVGVGPEAGRIVLGLRKQLLPAVDLVAAFGARDEDLPPSVLGVEVVGTVEEAGQWAADHGVTTALVVQPQRSHEELVTLTGRLGSHFERVLLVPDLHGLSTVNTEVRDLDGMLTLEVRRNLLIRRNQITKRALDFLLTISLGIIALPLTAGIALALALERKGSVLYRHIRVGRRGEAFTAWKFRTMVPDADEVLRRALEEDEGLRREWSERQKMRQDPRLTGVGRVLRRLSLDELPQLWNVVRGEMSLVGPRPIIEKEVPKYGDSYDLYKQVLPGLTGLWQVSGRSDLSYEERVRLDSYYVRNWSIWLDLVILLRTFLAVLIGRGAY